MLYIYIYTVTINSSQGQTLRVVEVWLEEPIVTHGQLYVTATRVGDPRHLHFVVSESVSRKTRNVVYIYIYTVTINSSQGQTLRVVEVWLEEPIVTHGQLYVTATRVGDPRHLHFVVSESVSRKTRNVVYIYIYTVTINSSQGQTLRVVEVWLEEPIVTHGQLYVTATRVGDPRHLHFVVSESVSRKTRNVVYIYIYTVTINSSQGQTLRVVEVWLEEPIVTHGQLYVTATRVGDPRHLHFVVSESVSRKTRNVVYIYIYTVTINSSQGQTLRVVEVWLEEPIVTHGQLYVTATRVGDPRHLHFVVSESVSRKTRNVVYIYIYTVTINSSQGQTLRVVEVWLEEPIVTHGQLYVTATRVGDPRHLHFVVSESVSRKTRNVVYIYIYTVTINSSQGQTLRVVEVWLEEPIVTHGQLYVTATRVGDPRHLHFVVSESVSRKTRNVVYIYIYIQWQSTVVRVRH